MVAVSKGSKAEQERDRYKKALGWCFEENEEGFWILVADPEEPVLGKTLLEAIEKAMDLS